MNKMLLLSALLLATSATMVNDLHASAPSPSCYAVPTVSRKRRASDCKITTDTLLANVQQTLEKYAAKFNAATTVHELRQLMANYEAIIDTYPSMAVMVESRATVQEAVEAATAMLQALHHELCRPMLLEKLDEMKTSAITAITKGNEAAKRAELLKFVNDFKALERLAVAVKINIYGSVDLDTEFVQSLSDAFKAVVAARNA